MTHALRLTASCWLMFFCLIAQGQAAKRVALVVGNDVYHNVAPLKKAGNDAAAMTATLKQLGFEVIEGRNLTRREMNLKLQTFVNRIGAGDVALIFFAGHGVEIKGANYLLPVDVPNAAPGQEGFVQSEAVGLDTILASLRDRKARLNILILDACRNNPFATVASRSLGGTRGLARITAPEGTFIMYSAGVGERALDRLSDEDRNTNSVFTRTLLPLLRQPGLSLVETARETRRRVNRIALSVSHQQKPAYYDEVLGDFFFTRASKNAVQAKAGVTRPALPAPRPTQTSTLIAKSQAPATPPPTASPAKTATPPRAAASQEPPAERLPDPLVKSIQSRLAALNYNPGPADGQIGKKTTTAIRSYQNDAGIKADGTPTRELLTSLEQVSSKMASVPMPAALPIAGTWRWTARCGVLGRWTGNATFRGAPGGFAGTIRQDQRGDPGKIFDGRMVSEDTFSFKRRVRTRLGNQTHLWTGRIIGSSRMAGTAFHRHGKCGFVAVRQ